MELQIAELGVLLLVAALVAILAARLRVPYVVGLVAAGIALSFVHLEPQLDLTKELVFTALLPPLVFEAALYLRWRQLQRELPVVLLLATVGVAISALITALGMFYAAQWAWPSALDLWRPDCSHRPRFGNRHL